MTALEDQAWAVEQLAQLRARTQHYPPVSEQAGWAHEAVRAATAAYGEILLGNCPPSEELHEALKLLTDSVMSRANAAIARHGERVPSTAGGKIEYATIPRVKADPDQPHAYRSLGENLSDGFCRVCGRDARHAIHAETAGWPWPYNPGAPSALRDEREAGT